MRRPSTTPAPRARHAIAVLALGVLTAQAPSDPGAPFTRLELVWVAPATERAAPACSRLAVLDQPRDWASGDAAVVLLVPGAAQAAAARPLAAALLAQQAAVLEFHSGPAEGCTLDPHDQVAEVLGAVRTLRTETGAGLVIAVGFGGPEAAVLAAVAEDLAARRLGSPGPRLAAAAARDETGRWTFRAGAPPLEAEHWQDRVPHLCAALAGARRADAEACRAALGASPNLAAGGRPARPRR
jgi:hypothetical protein